MPEILEGRFILKLYQDPEYPHHIYIIPDKYDGDSEKILKELSMRNLFFCNRVPGSEARIYEIGFKKT